MSVSRPAALTDFLAKHARKRLVLRGAVPTFDSQPTELIVDPRGAATTLAGEESAWDETRHAALGFLVDLPVFVDLSKKALPVLLLADGEPELVAASLEAFTKRVAKAPPPRDEKVVLEGPRTVPGKVPASWPKDAVLIFRPGTEGADFLRFVVRANRAVYFSHVRKGRTVGVRWKRETVKFDRGTGKWLDVSQLDMTPFGLVTARVKEKLESLQKKGLEFLPLTGDVNGAKGELFLLNVTRLVPCLAPDALAMRRLELIAGAVAAEPCLFRPREHPELVLATGPLVEALRPCGYSGLDFVPLDRWT